MTGPVSIEAVPGLPDIRPGDDLAALIAGALDRAGIVLVDGDIVVVAHKVVSKAEGRIVALADVAPGARADRLAGEVGKDPRKVEIILRESADVLRTAYHPGAGTGVLITRHRLGFVSANAGVDESNVGPGTDAGDSIVLLPEDPDASARGLRAHLEAHFDARVGVVITDTFGRAWRVGLVNVAIGIAGVPARIDLRGQNDAYGRPMHASMPAFADEVAAASGLASGKTDMTPVTIVRGLDWIESTDTAAALLRPAAEDLFL